MENQFYQWFENEKNKKTKYEEKVNDVLTAMKNMRLVTPNGHGVGKINRLDFFQKINKSIQFAIF